MLPLLTFLGLAFVAGLWPDSNSKEDESPDTARGDLNASGTSTGEVENPESPLTYAAAEPEQATDTLSSSDTVFHGPTGEVIAGGDGVDFLFGMEGFDTISGGAGEDTLHGLEGDDWLYGDDDAEGDALIGGEDHDHLWLGAGDTGTGGSGDDRFYLTEDIADAAVITDYNPDDDTIAVFYDANGPEPELRTDQTEAGLRLWADQQLLAIFPDTTELPLNKIQLVPELQAA